MQQMLLTLSAIILFSASAAYGAPSGPSSGKAREIEEKLVAPCCWSQPVSEHDSEISTQIRSEVAGMLAAGKSRDEILDFYVARYGERILVTPRAKGFNSLAYILPWAALPIGAWILILLLRKMRAQAPAPAPSTAAAVPATHDSRYDSIIEREMRELDESS